MLVQADRFSLVPAMRCGTARNRLHCRTRTPHGGVTLVVHALGNEGGNVWRLGATLYSLNSTRHHCHTTSLHKGVGCPDKQSRNTSSTNLRRSSWQPNLSDHVLFTVDLAVSSAVWGTRAQEFCLVWCLGTQSWRTTAYLQRRGTHVGV